MRTDEMRLLIDFNTWVNHRVLDAAAGLTDEQFRDPAAPTNQGLRSSLVHMLDTEWWWRLQVSGLATEDLPDLEDADYPDVASLRARWAQDEAEMDAWFAMLTDADLGTVMPPATGGRALPMWQFLIHRLMHSRQLQSDVATILSGLGYSPGNIDFNEFLRHRGEKPAEQGEA